VKKYATYYVEPKGIDEYEILSRTHADELFKLGYQSMLAKLKKL
jgi:NTE family protein